MSPGLGQKFTNLPDIPISNFILHFKQGGLVMAATNLCTAGKPALSPVSFARLERRFAQRQRSPPRSRDAAELIGFSPRGAPSGAPHGVPSGARIQTIN